MSYWQRRRLSRFANIEKGIQQLMWDQMFKLVSGSTAAMMKAQEATLTAIAQSMELTASSSARLWGYPAEEIVPADKRSTSCQSVDLP